MNKDWEVVSNLPTDEKGIDSHRDYNVGSSNYSKHKIQPYDIWLEYKLNPFDADIVKRVLRTKEGECRTLEYEKIIHICQERLSHFRKIDGEYVDTAYGKEKLND